MKVKLIYISAILIAFVTVILANLYTINLEIKRYHQHLIDNVTNDCNETKGFCTNLPIVIIDTFGNTIPEIENVLDPRIKINASISIINNTGVNYLTDRTELTEQIIIGYRGNSSLSFDKHQYSISVFNKNMNPKNVSFLGMEDNNSWVLNGPYLDKTQIRNYLAYNIIGEFIETTSDVRFCEVFLNGEYQGLYIMVERISRSMTGITSYKPKWSGNLTSYIVRQDRYNELEATLNNFTYYTNRLNPENAYNVAFPNDQEITDDLINYINKDFSKFEKMLYSYDYKDYKKYINVDSFVDYFIANEFFRNSDAGTHSTYLYKDVRGKITMGPVWDFNNAIDNYVEEVYPVGGFVFPEKAMFIILLKDQEFVEKIIDRYRELRNTVLNNNYIQNYIDETVSYLGSAIKRNFEVWDYTLDKSLEKDMLRPAERNYTSYEEALNQIKNYLEARGQWLDNNIEILYQYCHPSINKSYNRE